MSRIRADKLVNRAGTGAPELPYGLNAPGGLNVTGIVTASGGSSVGTGMSATGINTGGFFSNPNSVDAAITFNNPNHNYGMFGPVALNATVTVGAGNTFTVV